MLPILTRRVIFPTHERILRRPTLRYLSELERSQWWSPDDLRELQRVKLRDQLRHAQTHIPFWRARLHAAGIDVNGNDPLQVLGDIPLLDKAQIRASLDDLLWHDAPGGIHRHTTGGSSGEPLIFYLDRRRQGYDQAARIRSHRWFDVDIGDPELYLWGSPIEQHRTDVIKQWRDGLFNHRLLSAFDMSPGRMDKYFDAWDRFRPVCLFGYPSSIALFVEHALSRQRDLDRRRLRAVFVTGEVCYSHQRKVIADYFGVPVADGYGSRDAGFIAHECPQGSMHLTSENVIVEIVDRSGAPVECGETGEIVVTHLDTYAMPFIRYRTGDVGRLRPGRCTCGRGLPRMDVVQGRSTDFLYFPDGTVKHALAIIYPLRDLDGLRQFRVTQHEDYSVTVDVVADDTKVRITHESVSRCVRPVLGNGIDLQVKMVGHIDTTSSGKHRYVVSHAKQAYTHSREDNGGE